MRYFNLNNKATALCSLIGNTPSVVFDGDNLTENISKKREMIESLLKNRNYDVQGVNIEFNHDVTSALGDHVIKICSISCDKPDIRMNGWEVRVGGTVMSLFSDGSGSMEVYCGTDWNNDRDEFVNTRHFHRKLDGKSRIVLQYDKRGDTYMATDDCGRAYSPNGVDEPTSYSVEEAEYRILSGMDWLIAHIKNTPAADIDPGVFAEPTPTPLANPLLDGMRLYTSVDSDVIRQMNTRERGNYGTCGNWRLLTLGMKLPEDHQHSDLMHEGFTYCNPQFPGGMVKDNNWHRAGTSSTAVEVKLSKADNVFVVDAAVFDNLKRRYFIDNPMLEMMTDEDMNRMIIARGASMVHVNKYDGTFEKPVFIIGRLLSVDELSEVEAPK